MRLPVEQRAAVVAVDMQGYSVAETARMLGVAEGTVKSRCSRARAKLAEALDYFNAGAAATDGNSRTVTPVRPSNRSWWRLACVRARHNRRGQRWTAARARNPTARSTLADLQAGLLDDDWRQPAAADAHRPHAECWPPRPVSARPGRSAPTGSAAASRVVTARIGAALAPATQHRAAHPRRQLIGLVAGGGGRRRGRRRGDARARPGADAACRADGRKHHGVAAGQRRPAVGSGDRRAAVPDPGLRPARGPAAACVLPVRARLPGGDAGAWRTTRRHARAAGGAAWCCPADTPKTVRRAGRRAGLQFSSHRPAGQHEWSLVRNLSCRPRGTPGPTLVFEPVPT